MRVQRCCTSPLLSFLTLISYFYTKCAFHLSWMPPSIKTSVLERLVVAVVATLVLPPPSLGLPTRILTALLVTPRGPGAGTRVRQAIKKLSSYLRNFVDNISSTPKLVTVGSPYSSTSAAAYEYGGRKAVTIPRGHPFAGRTAGGATRGQVYGTKFVYRFFLSWM
jgi:hypothetical protein